MPVGMTGHYQRRMPDITLHLPGREAFIEEQGHHGPAEIVYPNRWELCRFKERLPPLAPEAKDQTARRNVGEWWY
jgi:hypothetical protein